MRNSLVLSLIAAGSPLCALEFATYEASKQPHQQTQVREERGEIRTIIDDVSSPMLLAMPGKLMPSLGQFDLSYHTETLYRENLSNQEARDEGEQHLIDARLRLRVWRFIEAELKTGFVMAPINEDPDVTDLDVLTVWHLYEDRYRGGAIAAGVAFPIGTGKALGESRKGDAADLTYIVQLRCTESLGFNVVHLNFGARLSNLGGNDNAITRTTTDGDTIPAGEWKNSQTSLEAALGYSYRAFRAMRIGAEGSVAWDWFDGSNDADFTDRRMQTVGFIELNPSRNMAIRGSAGVQPDLVNKDDVSAFVANAGLLVRF